MDIYKIIKSDLESNYAKQYCGKSQLYKKSSPDQAYT